VCPLSLAFVGLAASKSRRAALRCLSARFGVHHTRASRRSGDRDKVEPASKTMPDDGRKVVKAEKG
jgi:hypothetical protein